VSGRLDKERVRAAIEAAERGTAGEIVVSVARWFWGSVDRAAERAFDHLGIAKTQHRAGVLLFVAPWRRRVVVLGDSGIHAKVGPAFWDGTIATILDRIKASGLTAGVVAGVEHIGAHLAVHFPPGPGDVKSLPDRPR
jgi:uncharacterized membrane protein